MADRGNSAVNILGIKTKGSMRDKLEPYDRQKQLLNQYNDIVPEIFLL